jgi:hypothetical protein
MGRIAFPVFGERFMGKRSNTYIGVEVMLKNKKSGQLHKSLMKFKDGKRIEYMSNLAPEVYVIDEYREMVMGGFLSGRLKSRLKQMQAFSAYHMDAAIIQG